MSKASEMAKVSAKGGFHFFWGLVISTVISAVGTIIMARFLLPSEYGLYTIALAAPNLIAMFRDWGINSAMIKYTAQYNAENKPVKNILAAGLMFEAVMGSALSLGSFLLSGLSLIHISEPTRQKLISYADPPSSQYWSLLW